MHKRKWIAIGLIFALTSLVGLRAEPFPGGEVVSFLGDSITKGGSYHEFIRLFYATRFPERRIELHNAGIGGDRAVSIMSAADYRLGSDLLGVKPHTVAIMLGMNDVGRQLYSKDLFERQADPKRWESFISDYARRFSLEPKPATVEEARKAMLELYQRKMLEIIKILKAKKVQVILLSPSIYDETVVLTKKPGDPFIGVNGALGRCTEWLRESAEAHGTGFADIHATMESVNQKEQAKDPSFSLVGSGKGWNDRVHPGPVGDFVMAYAFLKSQGVPAYASRIEVDAVRGESTGLINCVVSDLVRADGGIVFDCKEGSLPMVPPSNAMEALRLIPFTEEMNRQVLRVSGLLRGDYTLKIDGESIGRYSAEALQAGVNLSTLTNTPQYRQSATATEITKKLCGVGEDLREISSLRYMMSKQGEWPADPAVRSRAIAEVEKATAAGKPLSRFERVLKDYVAAPGELEGRKKALVEELYQTCRTRAHRYMISPIR
jgi:hypothetical protein